jgi:glycosyltransferase involved in cell wall biosynthesis
MQFDVAITSFKRPTMLRDAVVSCLRQGPLLHKVIVVDDASGDNTAEVIRGLDDPRIVFFERAENGGIAAARRDAFALSEADWTISLDSDHELLPGAIAALARLLASSGEPVDILGARYRWDTGALSPISVPAGLIDYPQRIRWSSKNDSIGSDYLCVISRRVRETVRWEPLRAGLPDTLFQLDIAKRGNALFTPEVLALQKSDADHGWTRGSAEARWARRCQDAADAMKAFQLILRRHGDALRRWGKPKLASLYLGNAYFAVLCGRRASAWRWLFGGVLMGGPSTYAAGVAALSLLPARIAKQLYLLRG